MSSFSHSARLVLCLFLFLFNGLTVFGEHPTDDQKTDNATANQLIQEALYHEIYGRNDLRDQLLEKAAEQHPASAALQWHQGKVDVGGKWMNADEVAEFASNNAKHKSYLEFRDAQSDNEFGHMRTANWCNQNQLPDQERAHLDRVISFNPDNADARQRLGFVRLNDRWVNRQDLMNDAKELQTASQRLAAWREPVTQLRNQFASTVSKKQVEAALENLNSIDSPAAIPALEAVMGGINAKMAEAVVNRIANIEQVEATDSLIRFSVLSPWPTVRKAAAQALGKRDPFEYVPTMLAELSTPVIRQTQTIPLSRDRVIHRQVFVREMQDEHQVVELNTAYRLLRVNSSGDSASQMRQLIRRDERENERLAEQQNLNTQQMNDRITGALSVATGEQNGTNPRHWWSWWNDQNEVYVGDYKSVNSDVNNRQVNLFDRNLYDNSTPQPNVSIPVPSQRHECLVAGTPILTERGLVPVEEIKTGDTVLSQNVSTGELEYQPVLRPTVRPETMVFDIRIGDEEISASGGHPFWVSGQGWVRARNLKPGMPLHTPDGSVLVDSVTEGSKEILYNMIVAENQNYFVGKSRVLSHDNSLQEPTKNSVPGLMQ